MVNFRSSITFLALCTVFATNVKTSSANSIDFQKTVESHKLIGLPDAKAMNLRGEGQTIVFIDDGVQIDHP